MNDSNNKTNSGIPSESAGKTGAIPTDATVEKEVLLEAWNRIVPEEWRDIPPGINKDYMTIYRETGRIRKHA